MVTYGTIPPPTTILNEAQVNGHRVTDPLISKPQTRSRAEQLCKSMGEELSRSRADIILLLCYLVTGLLDSASTRVWGAFVSMQTGNTIFIGIGLASLIYPPTSVRLYRSGISLLAFCIGSFFFAWFHRFFSPKRRWVLCVSFAVQALFTGSAAVIVTVMPIPTDDNSHDWVILLPLALVAFQSSGQAVSSRALRYNALTSVVLTSIYCDLFSDPQLFAFDNIDRNRRVAAPLLLLGGAVMGGFIAKSVLGIQTVLWTATVTKAAMALGWLFWPAEAKDSEA